MRDPHGVPVLRVMGGKSGLGLLGTVAGCWCRQLVRTLTCGAWAASGQQERYVSLQCWERQESV